MSGHIATFVAGLPPRALIVMVPDQFWHEAISQVIRGMRPQFSRRFKVRSAKTPADVTRILGGWFGPAIAHESFRLEAAPETVSRFDALQPSDERSQARPGGGATQARARVRFVQEPPRNRHSRVRS